jgi:hypothetical protein
MNEELRDPIAEERLAELRGAMAGFEAPEHVKPAVLAAFRSAQARPRFHPLRWVSAAAAVFAVAAIIYWTTKRPVESARSVPEKKPAEAAVVPKAPTPLKPVATAPERAHRPRRKAASRPPAAAQAPRQEVATEFIAFPYAPPIYSNEEAQVIRVRLPRSAMRSVGLPVNEDRWFERVPADVLLGQDGVARAVRFVKVAQ